MDIVEDVVIVGAGIAGLATALGLHRIGLRSLVLESSESLRLTGFAFTIWTNAWKALDALGIGDYLRQQHVELHSGKYETRCVTRNNLLQALEKELPQGTIRFGSKVVSVEQKKNLILVHMADDSILKTKVLVGCDGVNSVVAKWLGLQKPAFTGRSAFRGIAEFPDGHGYKPEFLQYVGKGFRSAKDIEDDPAKMKQFVLNKFQKVPKEVIDALEKTEVGAFVSAPLRFRFPWNVLWGDICKGGVCVAGDALHPMTPDLGQGGCSALEDGVTLARCLGEALLGKHKEGEEECAMIKRGLEKYAKERRWRGFELIATAYVLGYMQQSEGVVMNFLRDKCFSGLMAGIAKKMETVEDIVIVGAGIAGLATALGLHRIGLRSLVLESSESLRVTGYAFTTWTNAWKALDALGIGDYLRQQHDQLQSGNHEVRCVRRNILLETLVKELPQGTIRFGSKVVSLEQTKNLVHVHLADGSILKTKVLVGCDGVNSVVSKWLGLKKPAFTGRSAIRGLAEFPDGHGYKPELLLYFGDGFRAAKDTEDDPAKMKQFVLSKLQNVPKEVINALQKTEEEAFYSTPLRFRFPWNVLWGDICKGGVCVAGDALHPMTPDLGQGGCSALEDGVTLARCLGEALLGKHKEGEDEYVMIKRGLEKYAKERRWRGFELIATAYVLGFMQQSDGVVMNFLRDKCFSGLMAGMYLKRADFDCGKLYSP
ncbi:FAD/NADP-binding oxidoreductase family protein [Cinnamomum micranthum f. kanehirae]|uniref:FAD/NADP-binding oxidoreductase family protein n=1 Tax=Cinnamomum micranthum f. kanehirae TaxID=337451 RepID=A0A3S3MG61_9MAGN|nr:FAD/NADP-binding oxidoreductase family protein [Cinnamomum micranthum f. kanehirae]